MAPPALDFIVRTCLAKDREERWQDARDLVRALEMLTERGEAPRIERVKTGRWPRWLAAAGWLRCCLR